MKAKPGKTASEVIEVSAGLVFRDGRVLVTQRRAGDHLGGLWEFPGGKRHPGESYEDCLCRELMEELGIEVDVGVRFAAVTHDYPEKSVHLEFFLCRWLRHEPRPLDVADFAWVDREQLANYSFPAADEKLLEKLKHTLSLWEE
ncbi:MAG TPA: (deoxy)nucleoside triphosphate pyrophosphohydrolase [Verrucomicrobiae bacterium]|nr:(deoxy)nucleoside triphosphate pyrophosphohydrolase [Verrucomicrobiae bacterium]